MIRIIADTTSTISPKEAENLGIFMIPQIIIFGDKAYRDDHEISSKEFLEKLKASQVLPKTAAPPPILYHPIYEQYSRTNDTIIVICPSHKVSGTYRSAADAALEFPEADIQIVDTQTIGPALGTLVKMALEMANEGKTADFIVKKMEELGKKVRIYFYVDTLEYLYKGGRIGAASALVGSILQVKPILLFKDGQVNPFEKQRTKKKALSRIVEIIDAECPKTGNKGFLSLSLQEKISAPELEYFRKEFKERVGIENVPFYKMPPCFMVHAGPGVIFISFFVD